MTHQAPHADGGRQGVVAVIVRDSRFLVIQRSRWVRAPLMYCFPGGGLEDGEDEETALRRELHEELGVQVLPQRRLWSCWTPSGVALGWWLADLPRDERLVANPREVASWEWMELDALVQQDDVLETNRQFLSAWRRGAIPFTDAAQ